MGGGLDSGAVVAVAGLLLTGAIAYTGVVMWLSKVQGTANAAKDGVARIDREREKDKAVYDRRLEKAESTALEIGKLTEAVRALGERLVSDMEHMRTRHDEAQEFTRQRFDDIAREISHIRDRR